jgi:hypothetical protein
MMQRLFLLGVLLFAIVMVTSAQEVTEEPDPSDLTCPEVVSTAIDLTKQLCTGEVLNENEACYGYSDIEATGRPGIDELNFKEPGDRTSLSDFRSVELSEYDAITAQWGVMVVELQILDETTPEDIQIVMFGNTQFSDGVHFADVITNEAVTVLTLPDDTSDIVAEVAADTTLTANAQLEDTSWLRVRLEIEDSGYELGWIQTDSISPIEDADLEALQALSEEEALNPDAVVPNFGPMETFVLQTGKGDAPCEEAPNSGLLIQTPEGVASVTIRMNELVISLDGSTYLQAEADGDFSVNVLDGSAIVESNGESSTALEGQAIDIELDENLTAISNPDAPRPINESDLSGLENMTVLLNEDIDIPDPLVLPDGVPAPGLWAFSYGTNSLTCPDGTVQSFESSGQLTSIQPQEDGLLYSGGFYSRQGTNIYVGGYTDTVGNQINDELRVDRSDLIIGTQELDLATNVCTLTVPFSLSLQSHSE